MKHWYIIYDGQEIECEFISAIITRELLYLKCRGRNVKIDLVNQPNYSKAKDGSPVSVVAHGKKDSKYCKIVFK